MAADSPWFSIFFVLISLFLLPLCTINTMKLQKPVFVYINTLKHLSDVVRKFFKKTTEFPHIFYIKVVIVDYIYDKK